MPARAHGDLPSAAERGRFDFYDPAEIGDARLCQLRLRDGGYEESDL